MSIDERLRKLLVYVGDEAVHYELRDVLKVDEVIGGVLIHAQRPNVEALLAFMISAVTSIPNKQHIYAVLTALLAGRDQTVGQQLIDQAGLSLQKSLNECDLYASKNLLVYFAELMNLGLLNSFSFYGLLQDLGGELDKSPAQFRQFYLKLIGAVMPVCWSSLSMALPQEFKKLIEKVRKFTEGLPTGTRLSRLWDTLLDLYSNGRIKDFSRVTPLKGEHLRTPPQFNSQLKLSFKDRVLSLPTSENEAGIVLEEEDEQYRQFSNSLEGFMAVDIILSVVHAYWKSKKILSDKLVLFVAGSECPHLPKLLIECLLRQALCRQNNQHLIVYSSLLVQLSHELDERLKGEFRKATEEISLAVFKQLENYGLDFIDRFADVTSLYFANVLVTWGWQKWIEGEIGFAKRAVYLHLVFEKTILLSENALSKENTKELSAYIPKSKVCIPPREIKEELAYMARTVERLSEKADSDIMLPFINNFGQFEMFLQCLLTRMSNSITHLNVLSERYRKLFKMLGRGYEKLTIVGINTFWANSQYHKQQYITLFIEKQIVSLEAFIQWTSVEAKVIEPIDRLLLQRLFKRVFAKCGSAFDNKQMLEEVYQSLEA